MMDDEGRKEKESQFHASLTNILLPPITATTPIAAAAAATITTMLPLQEVHGQSLPGRVG